MAQDKHIGLTIAGKYKLERKIGEGGMGTVYLGIQLMVDRPVAIKLLHAGLNSHQQFKQRFEVEAKAIGRLNHPNCITLYDFGFSDEIDAFYTVMEYLEGDPMQKRVIQGVSAKEAVSIIKQIAMALDHAHHQGILHRDLKPENIVLAKMTDGSELTKVLDFGIARIFQNEKEETVEETNRLTKAGEVFGTPAYISPEQARGERNLQPASDLYSLGIMFYEMLEGKLPFWGDTAIDTIMLHIQAPIPELTRIDIPDSIRQVCRRLMAKLPQDRYQSGKMLVEDLRQIEIILEQRVPVQAMIGSGHVDFTGEMQRPVFANMTHMDAQEWEEAPRTIVAPTRAPSMQTIPPTGPFKVPSPDQSTQLDITQDELIVSMKDAGQTRMIIGLLFAALMMVIVGFGFYFVKYHKKKPVEVPKNTYSKKIQNNKALPKQPLKNLPLPKKVTPKVESIKVVEPKKKDPLKIIPLNKDELPPDKPIKAVAKPKIKTKPKVKTKKTKTVRPKKIKKKKDNGIKALDLTDAKGNGI